MNSRSSVPGQRRILELVGKQPLGAVIGDPQGDAVRPDPAGALVELVERVLSQELSGLQAIDEQRVLDAVDDVDHLGIGPDSARIAVALGEFEFARFVSLTALKDVGEELILT